MPDKPEDREMMVSMTAAEFFQCAPILGLEAPGGGKAAPAKPKTSGRAPSEAKLREAAQTLQDEGLLEHLIEINKEFGVGKDKKITDLSKEEKIAWYEKATTVIAENKEPEE